MNHIQAILDAAAKAAKDTRGRYQMTLGKLLEALRSVPPETLVVFGDSMSPDPLIASYRGYYQDGAIDGIDTPVTAGELVASYSGQLGTTMEGYKGGDYPIDESVVLWRSPYGEASDLAIMNTFVGDGVMVIVTKDVG